jgi:hypothetical protein
VFALGVEKYTATINKVEDYSASKLKYKKEQYNKLYR